MMSKKKWITGLIAVVAIMVVVIGLQMNNKPKEMSSQVPAVKADRRVIAEGVLEPVQYSSLRFPVSGVVAEVAVKEGEEVKKGQFLARLINDDVRAKRDNVTATQNKANANLQMLQSGSRPEDIAQKQAMLAQTLALYNDAQISYKRAQRLFAKSANSKQELDKAETAMLKAEADVNQAQATLDLAKAGPRVEEIAMAEAEVDGTQQSAKEIDSLLQYAELRAPFDGTIALLNARVGEVIVVDGLNTVFQIANFSKWQVKTDDLTELNIAKVKVGAPVKITLDALPGAEFTGKVVYIRPYGEKKRGDITYTVAISVDGNDERFRWNMKTAVAIEPQ